MFYRDNDLLPRTYALKGFRRRRVLSLKYVFLYLFLLVAISAAGLVIYMTMYGLV